LVVGVVDEDIVLRDGFLLPERAVRGVEVAYVRTIVTGDRETEKIQGKDGLVVIGEPQNVVLPVDDGSVR
jgi:hypothetical protein